jgi:UDP-2,4-diacetamido-2,4,6-trideoxy-beta-L-altropyranose hydrolase
MKIDKKTIIFRADAGSHIGMGHFIRSLALAEMLKDNFYCIFATCNPSGYQIEEIERVCDARIDLPDDGSHFSVFLEHLNGDEIVVLDNYFFDTNYQRTVREKGCKLICIDDLHDKHYVADIVINHAITDESLFDVEHYTNLFLGLDYALIRKEFRQLKTSSEKRKGIILCLGGSDFNGLSIRILKHLIKSRLNVGTDISVVVGSANKDASLIKVFCDSQGINFFMNLSASEMCLLFDTCEFGIFPTSTIMIEALYRGLNVIGGYYVDNQMEFYDVLADAGFIHPIGNLNSPEACQKINSFLFQRKTSLAKPVLNNDLRRLVDCVSLL